MVDPRATWNQYQPEERRFVLLAAGLVLLCLGFGIALGWKLLTPAQTEAPRGYISKPEAAAEATQQSVAAAFAAAYRPGPGDSPVWFGPPRNGEKIFSSRQTISYFNAEQLKMLRSGQPAIASRSIAWSKSGAGALSSGGPLSGKTVQTRLGLAGVEATRAVIQYRSYLLALSVEPDGRSLDVPQARLLAALRALRTR